MTTRDYSKEVSYTYIQNTLDATYDFGLEVQSEDAGLNDNYIIFANKRVSIGKRKARNYVLFISEYATPHSNKFRMILTDKESTVAKYFDLEELGLTCYA